MTSQHARGSNGNPASRSRTNDHRRIEILSPRPRTVVAIVPDLLTATRIAATADQVGVTHVTARAADALETCRRSSADLVIVDLEAGGEPRPDAVIRTLKADAATRSI